MSEQESLSNPHETQLKAYEVGTKVYEQIFNLQKTLTETSNIFLAVTGAVWVAVGTNQLKLPVYASVAILLLHIVASVALLLMFIGTLSAIHLRFEFLPKFGEQFYPGIAQIGRESFHAAYGGSRTWRARFARWGRQRTIWYLIPIVGLVGSCFFLVRTTCA